MSPAWIALRAEHVCICIISYLLVPLRCQSVGTGIANLRFGLFFLIFFAYSLTLASSQNKYNYILIMKWLVPFLVGFLSVTRSSVL